jgi:hypothetical protein
MGNPCRWYYKNERIVSRSSVPVIPDNKKQVVLQFFYDAPETINESMVEIHFYSAPDVIFNYTDGSNNKNEFRRYDVRRIYDLVEVSRSEVEIDEVMDRIDVVCNYSRFEYINVDDPIEQMTNVPLGVFQNASKEFIEKYNKKRFAFTERLPIISAS